VDKSEYSETDVTLAVVSNGEVACMECGNNLLNARLIASAPEMHALLKAVLPVLEDCAKERHRMSGETRLGEHRDKVRELLAKVEGEK
jgi:NAD(P)H-dependent FMN reductase